MREHYDARTLTRTKPLYESIRRWAAARGDVTIIGGWAVYERVRPGKAQQSRDVDVLVHSEPALTELIQHVPQWGLKWRTRGRGRYYPDAHFEDESPITFRLDVFTTETNPSWDRMFGMAGRHNIKPCPKVLLPPTDWLVVDKLDVIPRRQGPDALDKQAKDLLDIFHLVFHNNAGELPRDLRPATPPSSARAILEILASAEQTYPAYLDEYEALRRWLGTS